MRSSRPRLTFQLAGSDNAGRGNALVIVWPPMELSQRHDVAIRVGEPSNPITAGVIHTPWSSCARPSYRWNTTPRDSSWAMVSRMPATHQPILCTRAGPPRLRRSRAASCRPPWDQARFCGSASPG